MNYKKYFHLTLFFFITSFPALNVSAYQFKALDKYIDILDKRLDALEHLEKTLRDIEFIEKRYYNPHSCDKGGNMVIEGTLTKRVGYPDAMMKMWHRSFIESNERLRSAVKKIRGVWLK